MNPLLKKNTLFNFYIITFSVSFFLSALSSCKEKDLRTMEQIVKNSKETELFFVSDTPTNPSEQITDKIYLCDYEVSSKISISKQQSDSLKLALLDTTNYIYDMEKKCMMMPKYAMRFQTKKDTLDIVFSDNPCAKAIANSSHIKNLVDKDKKEGVFYVDLTEKNSIIKTIEEILAVSE